MSVSEKEALQDYFGRVGTVLIVMVIVYIVIAIFVKEYENIMAIIISVTAFHLGIVGYIRHRKLQKQKN